MASLAALLTLTSPSFCAISVRASMARGPPILHREKSEDVVKKIKNMFGNAYCIKRRGENGC